MLNKKYVGINCSECGCPVGKGGYLDEFFNDDTCIMEIGHPLCRRCFEEQFKGV